MLLEEEWTSCHQQRKSNSKHYSGYNCFTFICINIVLSSVILLKTIRGYISLCIIYYPPCSIDLIGGFYRARYFDSEESLLKVKYLKTILYKRLFKREPRWRDMKDNSSRVRFIYSRFVIDHIRKGLGSNFQTRLLK